MEERRAYRRYQVSFDVHLKEFTASGAIIKAVIEDVSFGGMAIRADSGITPGKEVLVGWLRPPFYYEGNAVIRCVVVSVEQDEKEEGQFCLRVKFQDTDSKLVQSLLNWVQSQDSMKRPSYGGGPRAGQVKRGRF